MSTGVVVAVPARDEADGIGHTLTRVRQAIDHARTLGLLDDATVEVIAHRCTDATAARAWEVLGPAQAGRVVLDVYSTTVGEVRDRAARRGLAHLSTPLRQSWVLSTDADTTVGRSWVADILNAAARTGVVGVVGLAPLDRWQGTPHGAAAYARVLAAKMRLGDSRHQHDHVYGANLAVRGDAYLAVGGFSRVPHGEDQALVDALAAAGYPLLRTADIQVLTSGRLHGRAAGGLAVHLAALNSTA